MPLVEGIGDEVLQVFGICLVILLFITAWKSTAIRDIPQIRAVFIVDRRSPSALETDASSTEAPPAPPDSGQSDSSGSSASENTNQTSENNGGGDCSTDGCSKPNTQASEINAFRLSYFSNLQSNQTPSTSTSAPSETSTSTIPNKVVDREENENKDPAHSISVKLKYLNDDQKIVKGNLKELLGHFKRRHFKIELDSNKNVLLIFQGRVLREEETLETIGMYDNCVVHCLVKSGNTPVPDNGLVGSISNAPPDWNLGPSLVTILASLFALSWSTFWAYPHLFGITSTILLACLTTIYVLAVASMYYPQLFQSF